MGRIKLTAKSHLLGNTLPLLLVFMVLISVITLSGDFSLLVSYLFRIPALSALVSTAFSYRMLRITLSVIGIVISALTVPPIVLGADRWFVLKATGEETRVRDVFYFFGISRFLRSQSAFWYSFFIRAGVFLFFQFPAVCVFGVLYSSVKYGETAYAIVISLLISGILLLLTGLVFYFIYSADWIVYSYIIVSDDTVSLHNAYILSSEFAKNNIGKICFLRLSFVPWWLLSVLVFPLFYVWGYYKQTFAVLAYENKNQDNPL